MSRLEGELQQWNDVRGFGFIQADGGERYFVHVSSISRIPMRPRSSDRLSFRPARGRDGKPAAIDVQIRGANPLPDPAVLRRGLPPQRRPFHWQSLAAGVLLALLLLALVLGRAPLWLGAGYGSAGLVAFALYRADKQAAVQGKWRRREGILLGVDLCLGIIGGLLAQAIFRHKTAKPLYQRVTWLLVAVHGLWLSGLAGGWIDLEALERCLAVSRCFT